MIHLTKTNIDLSATLAKDFISDKTPLITAAGFAAGSPHAGQPRQTFSLALSAKTVESISTQMQGLYDEIVKECWPKDEVLPFDMIRFDAFLKPGTGEIKILELNTRNVGLHEVVEWLDNVVADRLSCQPGTSLNKRFVENQRLMHTSLFGPHEPLLYMTPSYLPRWIYFDELVKAYGRVEHITELDQAVYDELGIAVKGYQYKAITRKLAWAATDAMIKLNLKHEIRLLQPRWMRPFGMKNYLQKLHSPTILRTETFADDHIDTYKNNKDTLVLKIIGGGNSKGVYLGGMLSDEHWAEKLVLASQKPEQWIVQDYFQPPELEVIAHGIGVRTLPTQLGIFLLPKPEDPTQFDIDITVKAYAGESAHFTFDPSGLDPDIWFGHVLVTD